MDPGGNPRAVSDYWTGDKYKSLPSEYCHGREELCNVTLIDSPVMMNVMNILTRDSPAIMISNKSDIPAVKDWCSGVLPFFTCVFFLKPLTFFFCLSPMLPLCLCPLPIFHPSLPSVFLCGGGSLSVSQQRDSLLIWHRVKGHVRGNQSPGCGMGQEHF